MCNVQVHTDKKTDKFVGLFNAPHQRPGDAAHVGWTLIMHDIREEAQKGTTTTHEILVDVCGKADESVASVLPKKSSMTTLI